jgi:large subunit ribosomal protein L20
MARATKGAARKRAHNRTLKQAKGYWGGRRNKWRTVQESLLRSGNFAYRDRRNRKREMRRLWITRISAACKQRGVMYSRFIKGLADSGVALNRKMMAEIAVSDPKVFDKLLETAGVAAPQSA